MTGPADGQRLPILQTSLMISVLALVYALAAQLGLSLASEYGATLIWPASGIALAALLIWGQRAWPGVWVGAFAVSFLRDASLLQATGVAIANTLGAVIGAILLERLASLQPCFSRRRDVSSFILYGVLASTAIGATIGALALISLGGWPADTWLLTWTTWWMGDAAGVLVVTPALLTWSRIRGRHLEPSRRWFEIVVMTAGLVATGWLAFFGEIGIQLVFLPFPFLLWMALRGGPRGATTGSLLLAGIAITATAQGLGPFARQPTGTLTLWAFISVVAIASLLLTALLTEREAAERALRESESTFRRAFDNAPIGMSLALPDGTILQVNNRFARMVGYPREELQRMSFHDLTHPDDVSPTADRMQHLLATGEPLVRFEKRYLARDGATIWVSVNSTVQRDPSGQSFGIVSQIEDITELKRANEERRRLEEQLHQSRKMESIGQLAGGIAHDFNNLLLAVIGFSELGLRDIDDRAGVKESLTQIREAGFKASELTRQLLAFSRRQMIEPVDLDLGEHIEGLRSLLRRLIPESIELDFKAAYGPLTVHADPAQIEQVLLNLCVNSRDAMPDGGRIVIRASAIEVDDSFRSVYPWAEARSYVRLEVSDDGCGMPTDVRQRAFEPFFTTKQAGSGTGLGLSTVYGIVSQHGGQIFIDSSPGAGTRFEIFLPRVDEPAVEPSAEPPDEALTGEGTLLVAEDELQVRDLVTRILEQAGYTVLVAEDGAVAVEMFTAHQDDIDLVILDMVMPRMNGREACQRMRKLRPDLPILLTSGYSSDVISRDWLEDYHLDLLHKPYRAETLLLNVRRALTPAQPGEGRDKQAEQTIGR